MSFGRQGFLFELAVLKNNFFNILTRAGGKAKIWLFWILIYLFKTGFQETKNNSTVQMELNRFGIFWNSTDTDIF
jgi:hypothetical protein